MIDEKTKEQCCGCGVCSEICSQKCITMCPDVEGFMYPVIDKERCVECRWCDLMCPFSEYKEPECEVSKKAYIVRYNGDDKEDVLKNCTSGGAYTAFAKYILRTGGVACGAAYDENMRVIHTCLYHEDDFAKHSSSKYVQSDVTVILKEILNLLEKGDRRVLFSGTPCQIVALKRFLGKEYINLICVDLVCAGVSSPMVFKDYVNSQKIRFGSKPVDINFRKKTYGYHSSTMYIRFQNGKEYFRSRFTDEMMRIFTEHICDRPSCSACVVKGENRYSDLTIFDCWHYKTYTGEDDDDKGYTAVLVHSMKGNEFLNECEDIIIKKDINSNNVIELDGNMVNKSQIPSSKRAKFFSIYSQKGLDAAINATIPILCKDRIAEKAKYYLYKLNLLDFIKKLVYRGGWNY